jgi:thiol:disulfide interchange protein
MRLPRFILLVLVALACLTRGAIAQTSAQFVKVDAALNFDALQPGQQAVVAVTLKIEDGYHAQSATAEGDYIPLAAKLDASPSLRGFPIRYPPGHDVDYPALGGKLSVYDGTFTLFVPFEVDAAAPAGELSVAGSVYLQICNDSLCYQPSRVKWSVKTKVLGANERVNAINAKLFEPFDPRAFSRGTATTSPSTTQQATPKPQTNDTLFQPYSVDALREARASGKPVILKFTADWCVNCHVVERVVFGNADTLQALRDRGTILMKADLTDEAAPGWDLLRQMNPARSIPFTAVWNANASEASTLVGIYSSNDLLTTLASSKVIKQSATSFLGIELRESGLLLQLACAVLVGIVLNAVPCVLPVLPLKAVGFYEAAQHSRAKSFAFGVAFSLGIIATFGAIAVIVIGAQLDWGRMFSNPWFAGALTVLLLAAAAQAFGLFEFVLPAGVSSLEASHSTYTGNFLWGIITALLSTPCTIGMFAAVIAIALASGPWLGALILMTVGVGMALPYLVLSALPELARKFPRTGPWPNVVKQMMAFLLLATAAFFAGPLLPDALRGPFKQWLIFACVAASGAFLLWRTIQIAPRPRPVVISTVLAAALVVVGYFVRQIV